MRNSRSRTTSALLLLCLTIPLTLIAETGETPTSEELLGMLMAHPTTPYRGRVVVTRWNGTRSGAQEAAVYFRPPDKLRWDFFGPDGHLARRILADDREERVIPGNGTASLAGDRAKSLAPEQDLRLLRDNYTAVLSTNDVVAGRAAWTLELTPRTPGKPTQRFWIDQETQVLLKVRRFLPGESFAVETQFVEFNPGQESPETLFTAPSVSKRRNVAPRQLTREEAVKEFGPSAHLPEEIPEGFRFETADVYRFKGSPVLHARYTDGLAVLSCFLADRPIRMPEGSESLDTGAPGMRLSAQTRLVHWTKGVHRGVLMGDLSPRLMEIAAAGFQKNHRK